MSNFEFFGVGRVVFGRGEIRRLGGLAAEMGRSAMVVHNGPVRAELGDTLAVAGVAVTFRRQRGEPTVGDVDEVTAEAREVGCDVVIGMGGGSAIDAAKAVAGLLANGGAAADYMEVVGKGQKITRPAIPWIAVPTTAGTGAEATRNAVIGFPERHFKASIRSELLLPRVALIDPELALEVPPDVTARCGMDALCQCIESYTSTGAGPLTDPLALQGISLAARALPKAYSNGHDLAAREDMALAALISGITLTSAGLGAVHGFAAPLGANFPVPHGTVCAALLPGIIAANIEALRAAAADVRERGLSRYAAVGRALLGGGPASDREAIDACARVTADLARTLGIPPLEKFGLTDARVPDMVQLARKASSMRFNPVVLSDEALAAVLRDAIHGCK